MLSRFNQMRLPVRCPECSAAHEVSYSWLRLYGSVRCPACRTVTAMDIADLDRALAHLTAVIQELSEAVCRLSLPPPPLPRARSDGRLAHTRR